MERRVDIPIKENRGRYSYQIGTHARNLQARKICAFDFEKLVTRRGNNIYYVGKNHKLISPTFLTKHISDYRLSSIPIDILERRKEIGTNIMKHLQEMFENKIYDINNLYINERDRKYLEALIDFIVKYEIKILAVEKFITNGTFCGFVDMIGIFNGVACIFEIKCRNEPEVRDTDMIQVGIYKKMLNLPTLMIFINDNGILDCIRVNTVRKKGDKFPNYLKKMLYHLVEWKVLSEPKIEEIVCE